MFDENNNTHLWTSFKAINAFYANTKEKSSKKTTLLLIKTMHELLKQLGDNSFSTSEKSALDTAQAYWLEGATELEPNMVQLCNTFEDKIDYKTPSQDNKLSCLVQILSKDKDHFDDFPEFLENIHLAGLSVEEIQKTLERNFAHIPSL